MRLTILLSTVVLSLIIGQYSFAKDCDNHCNEEKMACYDDCRNSDDRDKCMERCDNIDFPYCLTHCKDCTNILLNSCREKFENYQKCNAYKIQCRYEYICRQFDYNEDKLSTCNYGYFKCWDLFFDCLTTGKDKKICYNERQQCNNRLVDLIE